MKEAAPDMKNLAEMRALVAKDFDLDLPEEIDGQALFDLVANEVAYLIENRIEHLMSMLYRLDVLEPHINHALSPVCSDPANIALAKLIIARQADRIKTKQQYKVNKDEDFGDLSF